MSWPSRLTEPATRAVGTVSCMRLRHRSSVDLPQPDGPMIAVTSRSRNVIETSRTASADPKNAQSALASRRIRSAPAAAGGATAAVGRGARGGSVATATKSGARCKAGCQADDEDNANENERASPGERVLLIVRADREVEDLQRQRGNGLTQRCRPELVA